MGGTPSPLTDAQGNRDGSGVRTDKAYRLPKEGTESYKGLADLQDRPVKSYLLLESGLGILQALQHELVASVCRISVLSKEE